MNALFPETNNFPTHIIIIIHVYLWLILKISGNLAVKSERTGADCDSLPVPSWRLADRGDDCWSSDPSLGPRPRPVEDQRRPPVIKHLLLNQPASHSGPPVGIDVNSEQRREGQHAWSSPSASSSHPSPGWRSQKQWSVL